MSEIKAGKLQAGISVTPANNFVLDPSADDGTLILRDSSGTALATLASGGEAELYARDNILGAVSESSGVPTGGIIESGSNSNGEYTKFADGTLVCRHKLTTSGGTFAAWSPLYVSAQQIWTYPHEFVVTTPSIAGYPQAGEGAQYSWIVIGTTGIGLITASASVCKTTVTAATISYGLIAIGRWF